MANSKDFRLLEEVQTSQANRARSTQRTTSQSYFSSSPSPPPSSPPPPPPTIRVSIPFFERAMGNASKRRKIVDIGRKQLEIQQLAYKNGAPIPAFDCSSINMEDFVQQSSNENAIERFSVCDWVDDSNIVHARLAMAELEKCYVTNTSTKSM